MKAKSKPRAKTAPAGAATATPKPAGNVEIAATEQAKPQKRPPDFANVRYGPFDRNFFDLWLAKRTQPTPLVVYIHGGGFWTGDKNSLSFETLEGYLKLGYSVAALNYRLTGTAPAPAAYLDCGLAVQTLRARAGLWNLDPRRVAAIGGSAGAGTSMWLAFHADLADPTSPDSVARQSTHFTCLAVRNGQPSYDPRYAERCGIPRPNFERDSFFRPFYTLTPDQFDTPEAYRRYEANAAITYLTAAAPPVWMHYRNPDGDTTPQSDSQWVVHHPRLGLGLQKKMAAFGLECQVHIATPMEASLASEFAFVQRHLEAAGR